MDYHFFDYKTEIAGYHGQDMFGVGHLIAMGVAFLAVIVLCVRFRHASRRGIQRYLRILSILILLWEIAKIVWETYYDLKAGGSFNFAGLLPLYTCSLFIYSLPLAAWCRGRIRECALSFLTTLGIFAGLTNFVYLNILNAYPLFTYAATCSFCFHFLMVFTGILLVTSGYYRPTWRSLLWGELLFLVYAIPVSLVNYSGNAYFAVDYFDYAFLYSGNSCPVLLGDLSRAMGPSLRPLYTVIVAVGHVIPAALVWGVESLVHLPARGRACRRERNIRPQ